jgi:hypothetical protein
VKEAPGLGTVTGGAPERTGQRRKCSGVKLGRIQEIVWPAGLSVSKVEPGNRDPPVAVLISAPIEESHKLISVSSFLCVRPFIAEVALPASESPVPSADHPGPDQPGGH